jgi:hypothetical protein
LPRWLSARCEKQNRPADCAFSYANRDGAASWSAQVQNGAASAAEHAVTLFDACDPKHSMRCSEPARAYDKADSGLRSFLEQLMSHHSAGAWHFAPSE